MIKPPVTETLNKRKALLLMAISTTFIIILLFNSFLFGDNIYLFKDAGGDSINVFYPKFHLIADYLANHIIPTWSFKAGLGQDIIPFSIGNLLDLPLYTAGEKNVAYLLVYLEIGKIYLVAALFYLFSRSTGISRLSSVIGSIMCSFSGYMIVGGQWFIFSTEMVHLIFLLYAVERYLSKGDKRLIPPAAALVAAFIPFNLYTANLLVFLFVIYRSSELGTSLKETARKFLVVIALQAAGCFMAAVFMLPNIYRMATSPRGVSGLSFNHMGSLFVDSLQYYATLWMRFFSSNIIGTGSNFTGWQNYLEAPLLQCGLLSVIMVPLFIMRNRHNRIVLGIAFIITAIVFIPGLRLAVWLFKGDYFRSIALFTTVPAVYCTARTLDRLESGIKCIVTAITAFAAALVALLLFRLTPGMVVINSQMAVIAAFLTIYLVLFLFAQKTTRFQWFRYSLLILVPLEMALINYPALNGRMVVTRSDIANGLFYSDESAKTVDSIMAKDRSFFRIHKEFSSSPARGSSLNDSMAQGYNGITAYGSFNHLNMVNFMDSVGVIDKRYESRTRWLTGLESSPLLMNLLNVKYVLAGSDNSKYLEYGYIPVMRNRDHIVLAQKEPLPFGYTYAKRIDQQKFLSLPPEKRHAALMKYCVLPNGVGENLPLVQNLSELDAGYSPEELKLDNARLKESSLSMTSFEETRISGTIISDCDRLLLFSMPHDPGWKASINGKSADLLNVNGGLAGLLIGNGESKIVLEYRSPFLVEGLLISLASIMAYLVLCLFGNGLKKARKSILPSSTHGNIQ